MYYARDRLIERGLRAGIRRYHVRAGERHFAYRAEVAQERRGKFVVVHLQQRRLALRHAGESDAKDVDDMPYHTLPAPGV
jgi:hypothetical protein